jgi:hypothetical protein
MPPKKDEHGNWTGKRPCGDYCPVNRVSLTDHDQLSTSEEIFDALSGNTGFTTLDLRWGYHQVKVASGGGLLQNGLLETRWSVQMGRYALRSLKRASVLSADDGLDPTDVP